MKTLQKKINYISARFCYENIQANDKLIVLYTGLPNSTIFEARLFKLIKDADVNYYLGLNVEKVSKIDQLLLTLLKLRLNTPYLDLAQRSSVLHGCVTNIFLLLFMYCTKFYRNNL